MCKLNIFFLPCHYDMWLDPAQVGATCTRLPFFVIMIWCPVLYVHLSFCNLGPKFFI
jgi:hypothetical protein